MARVIFAPDAKIEIKEAAEFYENCKIGLGDKFLSAIETAIEVISKNPYIWRKINSKFHRCLMR